MHCTNDAGQGESRPSLQTALLKRARRVSLDPSGKGEQEYLMRAMNVLQRSSRPESVLKPPDFNVEPKPKASRTTALCSGSTSVKTRSGVYTYSKTLPTSSIPPGQRIPSKKPPQWPPIHIEAIYPTVGLLGLGSQRRSCTRRCRQCNLPPTENFLTTPCSHIICSRCISSLCKELDDTTFPLICCSTPVPHALIEAALSGPELDFYHERKRELSVSRSKRVYCQNWTSSCAAFICSSDSLPACTQYINCPSCRAKLCRLCRHQDHPRQTCSERSQMENRQRMDGTLWRECPDCFKPVEQPLAGKFVTCSGCQKHICFECMRIASLHNHYCSNESPYFMVLDMPISAEGPSTSYDIGSTQSDPPVPPRPQTPPAASREESSQPVYPWTQRAEEHRGQTQAYRQHLEAILESVRQPRQPPPDPIQSQFGPSSSALEGFPPFLPPHPSRRPALARSRTTTPHPTYRRQQSPVSVMGPAFPWFPPPSRFGFRLAAPPWLHGSYEQLPPVPPSWQPPQFH